MKAINRTVAVGLSGLLLGAALILGIRFATYSVERTHYHANFALYINGQREAFTNPVYYTEIACGLETTITPMERAHMHDRVNDVVHVEDHAVTWGQFFENLGWYIGPNFIAKSDGTMYKEQNNAKLHVIINGQDYTGLEALTNMTIHDKDRVLISYGTETTKDLDGHYNSVARTAAQYDVTPDPESCSGNRKTTLKDRWQHLL